MTEVYPTRRSTGQGVLAWATALLVLLGAEAALADSPGLDKGPIPQGGPVHAATPAPVPGEADAPASAAALKGPARERDYFDRWHSPYGAVLDRDVMEEIWTEVHQTPDESSRGAATEPWTFLGPFGMDANGGARYSGRLLDFDDNGATLRFASASGGLWEFFFFIPITLTESLTSQAIGSVATDPNDTDHIFVGTGEGRQRGGTGLFETNNAGVDWDPVVLPVAPSAFYRIRYVPGRPTHLFAATTHGLLKSTNNGDSWTVVLDGEITDMAIWPHDPDRMWAGRWTDGIYTSTNAGTTWNKVTGAGLPTSNVGRVALTIHPGFPAIVYASIARNDNKQMLGVYRSLGGLTWTDQSPPEDFLTGLGGQGDYDNAIAVNPENWQEVLIGGVSTWRTDDGALTWTQINDPDMHADVHAIHWRAAGEVWVGHDGGFCYSNDAGISWASDIDVLPTVQFYNIDVGSEESNVMGGGTQDNGITMTVDGSVWEQEIAQDGSGFAVDVANPVQNMWATWGPRGGDWTFPPTRTTDRGVSWTVEASGIDPNTQWWTEITHDRVAPVYLYTYAGPYVYRSIDAGLSWDKVNTSPFPWTVDTFAISQWQPGGSTIWAATASGQTHQLQVWDGVSWNNRSPGLPNGRRIRRIAMAGSDINRAYVLMQGIVGGQQVYRTTDLGLNWTNVTGDLPAVPVGDIVQHPTDSQRLFLGTEMGCYRSTNGGANWERWNFGMPEANIVTDLATIDNLATDGTFYIVAGTYGRGLWKREIANEDPSGVSDLTDRIDSIRLAPPRPNPSDAQTTIEFSLRNDESVSLAIYDVAGRQVENLAEGEWTAGVHRVSTDVASWSPGVYFVHLQAAGVSQTRRLLVLR